MKIIDTHAHIYAEEFDQDRDDVLQQSFEKGLDKIYMPNIDHTSIDGMLELELKYPGQCIPMMGLHPCYVKKGFEKELYLVEEWLGKRSFAAIGEIGLDYYWDLSFKEQQMEALKVQVEWAKKYNRPIVLHCRNSIDETIEVISSMKDEKLRGIFHCYTGNEEQTQKILEMGDFSFGIGGVLTFKNGGIDKILPQIPLQKIVLETDSPYLAPVPHRGKRNIPSYTALVLEKAAEILKCRPEEISTQIYQNSIQIFS